MKCLLVLLVFLAGCGSEELAVYWGGFPDETVSDSVSVRVDYRVSDPKTQSRVCLIYQAFYDEPDYIIYADEPDTIMLRSGIAAFATYNYNVDNVPVQDTTAFIPVQDSSYHFEPHR